MPTKRDEQITKFFQQIDRDEGKGLEISEERWEQAKIYVEEAKREIELKKYEEIAAEERKIRGEESEDDELKLSLLYFAEPCPLDLLSGTAKSAKTQAEWERTRTLRLNSLEATS